MMLEALKVDMEEMKAALHTLENSKENLERQLAEQKMALKSVQKDKNDHEKKIIETTGNEFRCFFFSNRFEKCSYLFILEVKTNNG